MLPAELAQVDRFARALAVSMACFFAAVIVLPLRFHEIGIGEAGTGDFLAVVSLVAVGVAAMMPRVSSRLGAPVTLTLASLAYAVAHGVFAGAASLAPFVAGAAALGAGFGLSIPLVNHMTVEASPANRRGRALGNLSMAIFAGQCLPSFMHYTPGHGAPLFAAAGLPLVRRVLGGRAGDGELRSVVRSCGRRLGWRWGWWRAGDWRLRSAVARRARGR